MLIAAMIIGSIVLICLISFMINKILSRGELDNIKPYGKLVEVNEKRIHLYSRGKGLETIVLLPGLNIPLPCADFRPLMDDLAEKYTVVCVEYFGYGFSDETDVPRTNENYVEEMRAALAAAGFLPPYILMPYSASGIYSEYYAAKYPEEVAALILIDTTSSAEAETAMPPRFIFNIVKLQQAIGLARFLNPLVLPKAVGLSTQNGYTQQEIKDFIKFANHVYNNTLIDQNVRFPANVLEVMSMEFSASVPVLAIKADIYSKGKWSQYLNNHMKKLGKHAKCDVIAESNHASIYHDRGQRKKVCEAIGQFLESRDE